MNRNNKLQTLLRNQTFRFVLKVLFSAVALWFVFKKVDFQESWSQILQTNWLWLLVAVIWFNLIKIGGVFRLSNMLKPLSIRIPFWWNVRLYYIGAFYNLFLPGSVGGDGYKVFLLKDRYNEKTTARLLSAVFLDRLSGMAALFTLTGALVLLADFQPDWPWFRPLVISTLIACYPLWYLFCRIFFRPFLPAFLPTNLISFGTQSGMVLFAWMLLQAIGVEDFEFTYIVVFMIASVISIIPFTLGGVGARETIFVLAAEFTPIDPAKGVNLSLLVFTVLASSALVGLILNFTGKTSPKEPTEMDSNDEKSH